LAESHNFLQPTSKDKGCWAENPQRLAIFENLIPNTTRIKTKNEFITKQKKQQTKA